MQAEQLALAAKLLGWRSSELFAVFDLLRNLLLCPTATQALVASAGALDASPPSGVHFVLLPLLSWMEL